MDYKETLNLPRTDFAMKADLVTREPERLKKWEATGLYEKIQAARAGAERFVLHDGPPFANGDVHIGNALNKILKDIIVKYKSIRGFSAPYVPGWDCHGLPIEFKVSQEMRKAGNASADSATIRKAYDEDVLCEIDVAAIDEIDAVTKHDVIAFLTWAGDKLGPERRWLRRWTIRRRSI